MPVINTVTLYGNVGADPESRTIPARQFTKPVYDPIIDDTIDIDVTKPEREFRTFSIAINQRNAEGEEITRWVRCTDWNSFSRSNLVRKGDRVKVKGYFKEDIYEKEGETKTSRQFVVVDLSVERRRTPPEVA